MKGELLGAALTPDNFPGIDQDEKLAIDNRGRGSMVIEISWFIAFVLCAIVFKLPILIAVGSMPLIHEFKSRIEKRKIEYVRFNEVPVIHPLYHLLDWTQFENNLRIYVSKKPNDYSGLLNIAGSRIYLDSSIFSELEMESIAWIIRMNLDFISRKHFHIVCTYLIILGFAACGSSMFLIFDSIIASIITLVLGFLTTAFSVSILYQSIKRNIMQTNQKPEDITIGLKALEQYQLLCKASNFRNGISFLNYPNSIIFQKWLTEAKTKALERKSD